MQTITQTLRPYLRHVAATADALDRAKVDDAAWGDLAGWQEQQAHDCAMLHARLAAKRHYASLRGAPVPVYPFPEAGARSSVYGALRRHCDAASAAYDAASTEADWRARLVAAFYGDLLDGLPVYLPPGA